MPLAHFYVVRLGAYEKVIYAFRCPLFDINQILSNRNFVSLSPTMLMICSRKKQDHPVIVFGFLS